MAKLRDNRSRAEYYIVGYPTSIGRHGSNGITLPGHAISRFHAEIGIEKGQFYIQDMGSTFGTHVNGRRIKERVPIFDGDRITLGVSSARSDGEWDLTFSTEEVPEEAAADIRQDLAQRRKVEAGGVILEDVGGALVARLLGLLRGPECDAMARDILSEVRARPRDLVLDLEALTYVNSYFLGTIGKLWLDLRDLELLVTLSSAKGRVLELLEMVGLWTQLGCHASASEAAAALQEQRRAQRA